MYVCIYVFLYKYKSRTYTNIVSSSHNSNQSKYGLVASTRPVSLMPVPGTGRDSNNKPVSTEPPAPQGHVWGGDPTWSDPINPPVGSQKSQCLTWQIRVQESNVDGKIWWQCPTLVKWPQWIRTNEALTMTRILTWPTLPTLELLNHVESTYQLTRCPAHQNAL